MGLAFLVSFFVVFILVTTLMYVSLQRLDFSKMFKANSTTQIRAVIVCVSAAIGFIIAIGFNELLNLILNI